MRKFLLIGLLFHVIAGYSQNSARVVEYLPAPGQHINIGQIGTPQAAQNMAESENSLVSLGAFGGYAVLKFDEPCVNDAENPHGIDFTVFGNAFSGSSEPGVVWVMKDENQNGQPDDTWYEIAGSHYFYSKTVKNYAITYFKTASRNIEWKDNFGKSGIIKANSYNTQEYYPTAEYFPEYPSDSVVFTGTKLPAKINSENSLQLSISVLDFGYADNHPKRQGVDLVIPDNPYTTDVEGAGGDPIDISWAVDREGKYVDLDEIHFVKIVTGYLADLGRLGEASTDVSYVVDAAADATKSGNENLLVVYHPPSKMVVGDAVYLEAAYFNTGLLKETDINFSSSNFKILEAGSNGELIAQKPGNVEIRVNTDQESKTFSVDVVVPDSIAIQTDFSAVYPGDTIMLDAQVFDNIGDLMEIQKTFLTSNSAIGKIIQEDNNFHFIAEKPGEVAITCQIKDFDLQKSVSFRVLSENDKIQVWFTLKNENENLFPRQRIDVGLTDLNGYVENRNNDYSELSRLTLAHAILAGLQKTKLNFAFRDDENSGQKLYLYSIENDGLFSYGWGGKTEPQAFARAWIARLNISQYLYDFDAIDISNGDTIALYHISDINSPWTFSRLTTNKDSAVDGEAVELLAEQTTCRLENDTIFESSFVPLENREIVAGESYFTNENGKVEVTPDSDPPWIFYSDNNAVLIHEKVVTDASFKTKQEITIYPNPVTRYLHVNGENISGAAISILNSTGKLILQKNAKSEHASFNVSSIKNGLYFLKIENEAEVKTMKFIKRK